MAPKALYVQNEMRRRKKELKRVGDQFCITFGSYCHDTTLQENLCRIKYFIFYKEASGFAQWIVVHKSDTYG